MQQRRRYVFDRGRSSVPAPMFDSWRCSCLLAPRLSNCNMAVCEGCALDGDNRLFQLSVEIFGIHRPKHFVSSGSESLNGFFMLSPSFSKFKSNPEDWIFGVIFVLEIKKEKEHWSFDQYPSPIRIRIAKPSEKNRWFLQYPSLVKKSSFEQKWGLYVTQRK